MKMDKISRNQIVDCYITRVCFKYIKVHNLTMPELAQLSRDTQSMISKVEQYQKSFMFFALQHKHWMHEQ
ncbi:hypothetical protein LI67_009255 [Enterobacter roggenkampii]|nr:hypothetical protein LI67_009255 [Enterobacter roggenkampii]KJN72339.1 hypothetical protein SS32_11570 [Enterobacter roggenkampii]